MALFGISIGFGGLEANYYSNEDVEKKTEIQTIFEKCTESTV